MSQLHKSPANAASTRARPNPSVKASPNSWPGLPFLGHFGYRPIQVMPGQLSGPPYLERYAWQVEARLFFRRLGEQPNANADPATSN